jgi:CheY-like chemotaxis protein
MKTNSEFHGHAANVAKSEMSAPGQDHLSAELRPQLDAIIELAERLKTSPDSDENAQQILTAARELIDTINRKPSTPRNCESAAPSVSSEQCDVLYIEDNPVNFASVKLLLGSKRALKVLPATSGENGVAFAQAYHPKLILLDLDLPDTHGSEVIQRLQKHPQTGRIPVVVISGDATPSQIERLLVLGARNYLTKPFEIEPFLAIVDEALEQAAT